MLPMSTSRSYHHGDLRATLLATTRSVLAEVGIEGLSLREVSRRAGVSHAAAYNHFRDKASLIGALVSAAFERLATEMHRSRSNTREPFERLRRIGVAYVRFAYRNPVEFKLMFRPELCGLDGPPSPTGDGAYRLLVETIVDCQAAGAIAAGPTEPLVLAAWSMVHGLAALIVDGPDRRLAPSLGVAERLAAHCVDVLADGLRA